MPLRALRLAAASLPLVAAFTVVGVGTRVGPVGAECAQASSAHHAALVVEHQDGAVTKLCVAFSGVQVTGQQVLDLSGVPYRTTDFGSYGKAVCQIEGEPASYPPSCWTASSPYWAIFVSRGGGAWVSSSRGISTQTFADGDAEGFRYVAQSDNTSTPAPAIGVCPPPVPPTSTPVTTSPAAASARPGTSGVARSHPTAAPTAGATSAATPAARSAPTSALPTISPTPPVAGQVRVGAQPPASPGSPAAAVWVAAALGASLLVLLAVRLVRPRRTRVQP